MIHDVDESLRELVRRDVLNGTQVEVSFETPNRDWASRRNSPSLNFYLYDIKEDLERRQVQFEEIRDDDGFVVDRRQPPRRFKLAYLVTAWTQRPEDEHRLLSAMISCFVRYDALPVEVLQGELARQPYPVRVTAGLPLPPERSISDVWTALGGELKASLDVIVTTPFPTGRQAPVGPPVLEEPRIGLHGPGGVAGDTQAEESEAPAKGAGGRAKGRAGRARASEAAEEPEGEAGPAGSPKAGASEPRESLATETVHRGRGRAGRTLIIRHLPPRRDD